MKRPPAREAILAAYQAAISAADPRLATAAAINRLNLASGNGRCDIVAIGKAASGMAAGAVEALGPEVRRVFVLTKDGHSDPAEHPDWTVRFGAHPVLDERSLSATTELLTWLGAGDAADLTLCLISGGGSALLEKPVDGVSLGDFQRLTQTLLHAGADIRQLNTVRSRVSQVKSGGLRRYIRSEKCVSLLLSDVMGNDSSAIASGPTVPSAMTAADAIAVIDHLGVRNGIPDLVMAALHAIDLAPYQSDVQPQDLVEIVADNPLAIEAASASLTGLGFTTVTDFQPKTGEARDVSRAWVEDLNTMPADIDAIVSGGELTVTVHGDGIGGRNTEFALAAAKYLKLNSLNGWMIASLATDGQDALTGVAGAIVDAETVDRCLHVGFDPDQTLAANDSFTPLDALEAVVRTGPTGTNVNDLYFAIRTD